MNPILQAKRCMVLPAKGTKLRTKSRLLSSKTCEGFLVGQQYIDARKPKTDGEYLGMAGGGGDLWWAKHLDGVIACYSYTEITDI